MGQETEIDRDKVDRGWVYNLRNSEIHVINDVTAIGFAVICIIYC